MEDGKFQKKLIKEDVLAELEETRVNLWRMRSRKTRRVKTREN